MSRSWSRMLSRLFRKSAARPVAHRTPKLRFEQFEDRVVPATIITIQEAAGTLDGFLSATDGTIDASDLAGSAGTLSRAALEGVNPDVNISIAAETQIIVGDLTSTLSLQTGAGFLATFLAGAADISFTDANDRIATAGGDLNLIGTTAANVGGLTSGGGNILVAADNISIAPAVVFGANLVANPGFETGSFSSWTQGGNTISTGVDSSTPHSGTFAAFLGPITTNGTLSQNVATVIGQQYQFSFWLQNSGGTPNNFSASADGSTVFSVTNDGAHGYQLHTFSFTATAVSTPIQFSFRNDPSFFFLDDIAVQLITPVQTIDAGAGTVHLDTFNVGTAIDLGGADGAGTLGLTDAELDRVTAGTIVVGNALNFGSISVTAAISPGGTSQLELQTGGSITGGGSIAVSRLGLTGGAVIGAAGNPLDTTVGNLEAFTPAGGIFIDNTGTALTLGGVNATLSGVHTDQNSITITNSDTITIGEGISIGGVTGSITVTTTSNNINVNGAVTTNVPTGAGNITLNAEENVIINAAVSAAGDGDITIIAEPTLGLSGSLLSNVGGTITAESGDIRLQAMDNVTLNDAVGVTAGTGSITIVAELTTGVSAAAGNFTSAGLGTLTTAGGDISIQAGDSITVGAAVSAGGAGGFTATADAAIDSIGNFSNSAAGTISAGGNVTIGGFDINQNGAVSSTAGGNIILQATHDITSAASVAASGGDGLVQLAAVRHVSVAGAVSAEGTGTISLRSDNDNNGVGDLTVQATGSVTSARGGINIAASGTVDGGTVTIGGPVSSTGGPIAITSASDVNVNAAVGTTTNNVFVIADGNFDGNGNLTSSAPGTITTTTGAITVRGGAVASVAGDITSTGGGSIDIQATAGSATIAAIVAASGGNGNVSVTASRHIDLSAPVSAEGAGDILLTSDSDNDNAGHFTSFAGGSISTAGGDITILGGTAGDKGSKATIGDAITIAGGSGDVTVSFRRSVIVNAPVSVTGTGGIGITADGDGDGQGDFVSNAGGTLTTTTGDINLLGSPNGLHGGDATIGDAISITGGASGTVTISFGGNVTFNAAVLTTGNGNIVSTGNSDNSGGEDTTINAPLTTTGGDVIITNPGGDIIVSGNGSGYTTTAPAFNLQDISGTGTNLNVFGDDTGTTAAIGFTFNYFGVNYTDIGISSNGYLAIPGQTLTVYSPDGIPSTNFPNGIIAGRWSDLQAEGNIFTQTIGAPGSRVFIVQYQNYQHLSGGYNSDFEFKLFEGSNAIEVHYGNGTAAGEYHVAGIENQTGTRGVEFFNNSSSLPTNTAVRYTPVGVTSNGGNITLSADDMTIGAPVDAGTGIVTLQQADTTARDIWLGGGVAGVLGLTDAELDLVTASFLRIGRTDNAGTINVIGQITEAGSGYTVLSLRTGGAVVDATAADVQDDITVTSLAIRSATGIGSADTLNVAVSNLAIQNTTSGNVFLTNNLFSAAGTLNITSGIDGLDGVTQDSPGDVFISNHGDTLIDALVSSTAGGNITLTATGNLTLVTDTGAVSASGGNGDIFLSAGGQITINPSSAGVEVKAAGTGDITLDAGAGVLVTDSGDIQSGTGASGGGTITIRSNVGNVDGTADIVLGDGTTGFGPNVNTRGDIVLDADPDGNCVGGTVITTPNTTLKSPGFTGAANIHINVATDIILRNALAVGNITVHSCQNIFDDGDDATIYAAGANISLDAFGIMGGLTPITTADILSASTATPSANYRAALDVAYGGTITVHQDGSLGNIQIRKVGAGLNTNSVLGATGAVDIVGTGNQLALISAGGDLTVNNVFTLNGSNNADLFLASVGGNNVVITGGGAAVNNGATATTTVMASGSTTAAISGPAPDGTANIAGTNILLATSGGDIGTGANPIEINASATTGRFDGFTNGTVNSVTNTGGNAFITDTQNGIRVGQFNAGTTGDVTLASLGNITPTGSSIVAVTHNDNTAEIIGDAISLSASGTSTGTGGQIGLPAQFFEVNSNTLGISTNNSNFWVSEVGTGATAGTAITTATVGTTAGTVTGFLRVRNGGTITSAAVDGTADVIAPVVNLSNLAGDTPTGGGFGTSAASPLEINGATLNSNLAGGGNEFVRDQAGGLVVQRANTTAGNVGIETVGGNLVLGNANSTGSVVLATGGNATLSSSGSITSAAPATIVDVTANALAASGVAGVGTSGTPLETAIGKLSGGSSAGGFFVTNTGGLDLANIAASQNIVITTVDVAAAGQNLAVLVGSTVSSSTGNATLQSGDNLSIPVGATVSAAGAVTLAGDFNDADAGTGATVDVLGKVVATTASVLGGADSDTIGVSVGNNNNATVFTVNGNAPVFPTFPGDTLNLFLTGVTTPAINPTGNGSGTYSFGNRPTLTFTSIENLAPGQTISGTVFLDVNRNGVQDSNEQGISATVHLDRGNITDFAVTNTDADGHYSFLNNTPGDYTIRFDANPEFVLTTPNPAVIDFSDATTGIDFGTFGRSVEAIGGPGNGSILIRDSETGATIRTITPYPNPLPGFIGSVQTAVGDVNGDGYLDVITGAGPGAGPHVKAFSGRDGTEIATFFPYAVDFSGGVYVAAADLDGDGKDEIITGAGENGGPHVKVYKVGATGVTEIASFFAYAPTVRSGVNVGGGDVNGDGLADIITGARGGEGFAPHVKVFSGANFAEIRSFFAYSATFYGGVFVAGGDIDGDGFADIITGTATTAPHVKVFSGQTGAEIRSFYAFDPSVPGVSVGVTDEDNDGTFDILVGSRIGSHVKVFDGTTLAVLDSFFAFDNDFNGVFVGGA